VIEPRVYVSCLHCYNAGRLHGEWFDVPDDPDDLLAEVLSFFGAVCVAHAAHDPECAACVEVASRLPCGGEELAVHDHEGLGAWGESFDPQGLCQVAALVRAFPERPALAYLEAVDSDIDAAREGLEERYSGAWDSLGEWAESHARDMGLDAEALWSYVDWERYGRDLELGGGVMTLREGGAVHVFWS